MDPAAVSSSRLLERDAELGAIADALAAPPRLLIAEGAAGLGKTRLLDALCERASAGGAQVLRARGAELGRALAFGAARQLFEPLLIRGVAPEELFAGPAELARPVFELTENPEGDPYARIHGLYCLAVDLTRGGPLVIAVDDLQWCDEASVRFVAYLARRLHELPIVVALAMRPLSEAPADARALGAVFAEPGAVRLRPAALGEESVAVLARRHGLDPGGSFVAACLGATGGNPFLLGELLREVGEASPAAVERIGPQGVAARLARLEPAPAEVARALAILGDGSGLDMVAALAGIDRTAAAEAVLRLEAESVVTRAGGLAFVHPIVRRAALAGMGPVAAERRHAAAAALLAKRGAPSREIAAHLLRAEPAGDRERVAALHAAASEASGLGDPAAAAELLRRAVAEAPPRAELLVELGEAERHAGAGTATATLESAVVASADLGLYARAVESLADVHMHSGRALRAARVLEEAVERVAGTPDAERLGIQLLGVGHVSIAARRHLEGRIRALELPGGEPRTSAELMALATGAWGAIVDHGDAELARELGARVLGFSGEADMPAISALIMTTVALMCAEDLATAGRVQENMVDGARRRGALQGVVAMSSLVALTRWRAGDIAGSVDAADTALELGAEITGAEMLTHAGVAAALLAGLDAGREPEALLGVLRGANLRRDADLLPWSQVLIGEAAVHAARGDHAAALDRLRACDLADSGWGRDCPSLVPWRSGAALSLAATGAEGDASELAEEEVELARRAGTPRALGWALRARALVGPARARREGLERALEVLAPLGTPAVTARVRADLGAQLRRDGEHAAARELLSAAHAEAAGCGAQAIAGEAAAELRALGTRPSAASAG